MGLLHHLITRTDQMERSVARHHLAHTFMPTAADLDTKVLRCRQGITQAEVAVDR